MRRRVAFAGLGALMLVVSGCGGGESQDANEPPGNYRVEVADVSFPDSQQISETAKLRITVRNTGDKTVPNVAVTIGKNGKAQFSQASEQPGLADPERPIWVVNTGPRGGTTAYVNTWTLGKLPPGRSRTFEWDVTAVVPGAHTLDYRVNGGLDGKARAVLAGGGIPEGSIDVSVTGKPSAACVTPSGEVVREGADAAGNCPG